MYVPLNCKTHYSVLEAYQKPKGIVDKIEELGIERFAVCENRNMSSSVQVLDSSDNAMIGMDTGRELLIARNLAGWYEIVRLNNQQITLEDISIENVVVIYKEMVDGPIDGCWWGVDLNGRGEEIRKVAPLNRRVAIPTFLCANEQDQEDYKIVLCIKDNCSLDEVEMKYADIISKNWYLRSYDNLLEEGYTKMELENTFLVSDLCENIKLPSKLQIPDFPCPDGETSNSWIKKLCNKGFKSLDLVGKQEYIDQIRDEILVIEKYELEDYFLIIKDIIDWIDENYGLSGVRGSAAGCLLSYLIGITKTDPLKFNLFFSRFLNEGRFTEDRVQPPDIDIDIPSEAREDCINWIRDQYGLDKTGQILTYQTIKSPAAIKAVFRVRNTLAFDVINKITKLLPPDHKISDKMKESGDKSVIMWCLKHKPKLLEEWVRLEDDKIVGDYANEFKQAVRLEGTISARSKHAAGLIVSREKLTDTCPLVYDDVIDSWMCGMEMNDLESIGLLKLDLLGLRGLSKMLDIKEMVEAS